MKRILSIVISSGQYSFYTVKCKIMHSTEHNPLGVTSAVPFLYFFNNNDNMYI